LYHIKIEKISGYSPVWYSVVKFFIRHYLKLVIPAKAGIYTLNNILMFVNLVEGFGQCLL